MPNEAKLAAAVRATCMHWALCQFLLWCDALVRLDQAPDSIPRSTAFVRLVMKSFHLTSLLATVLLVLLFSNALASLIVGRRAPPFKYAPYSKGNLDGIYLAIYID